MQHRGGKSVTGRSAMGVGAAVLAMATLAGCASSSVGSGAAGAAGSSSTTSSGRSSSSGTSGSSGNSGASGGSSAPGVSANSVTVGAISTLTGAISAEFDGFVRGMTAYFDTVNAQGGINGRKLTVSHNLDDGSNPSQFTQLTHTLVDQDHVFAVGVSTYFFSPNYYVETKTPTYGYNVSGNWQGPSNLFAAGGSVQAYNTGASAVSYLIKRLKAKSIAVISYGSAVASSYDACKADADNLKSAGVNVSYEDLNASLGGSFTSTVQRMQQSNVDFVVSCMQGSDNISLSRAAQQYGLKAHQLWFDGYDQSLLDQYSKLMQGVYLNINGNVPFQASAAFPGKYPGMAQYLSAMNKYAPQFATNQVAMQGWQSGVLLADGIKAAGNNLTQQNVINLTNQISDFTAGGLTTVTNWTTGHSSVGYPLCSAFVKVSGKKFVPTLGQGHQVFVCFGKNTNLKNPKTVPAKAGTPGT